MTGSLITSIPGTTAFPLYSQKIPFLRYGSFSEAHPEFWPFLGSNVTKNIPKNINGEWRFLGSGKNWQRNGQFSEKNGQENWIFGQKSIFCGTPIFSLIFTHLILLQKLIFFILCTLLSNVENKASPKCPYPRSALSGSFWPKTRFAWVMILSCLNNIHNLLTIQVTNQDSI